MRLLRKKTSDQKTKLRQGLLKALREILVSEGSGVIRPAGSQIESDTDLMVIKDKIAELKASLLEGKNESMKPALQKAARIQVEALIRELEASVRVYETARSRE